MGQEKRFGFLAVKFFVGLEEVVLGSGTEAIISESEPCSRVVSEHGLLVPKEISFSPVAFEDEAFAGLVFPSEAFEGVAFEDEAFGGVAFPGVAFEDEAFRRVAFAGVAVTGAAFTDIDFIGVVFTVVDFIGVVFTGVAFTGVHFIGVDFTDVDFVVSTKVAWAGIPLLKSCEIFLSGFKVCEIESWNWNRFFFILSFLLSRFRDLLGLE